MKYIIFIVMIIMSFVTLGTAETVHVGPYLANFFLSGEHSTHEIPGNLKITNDGASYTTYSTKINDISHVLTIEIARYSKPMDTSLENEKISLGNNIAGTNTLTFYDGYIDRHSGVLINAVDASGRNVYGAAYWIDPYTWVILTSYYPWNETSGMFGSFHIIPSGTSNPGNGCLCTPGSCRQVGNNLVCDGGSCSCNNGRIGFGLPGSGSPGIGVGGPGIAVTTGR